MSVCDEQFFVKSYHAINIVIMQNIKLGNTFHVQSQGRETIVGQSAKLAFW